MEWSTMIGVAAATMAAMFSVKWGRTAHRRSDVEAHTYRLIASMLLIAAHIISWVAK